MWAKRGSISMSCARGPWTTACLRGLPSRFCLLLLVLALLPPQLVQPVRPLAQLSTSEASNSTTPVDAQPPPPKVMLVVARCTEDLHWLESQTKYPYLVYQKCQQSADDQSASANHRSLPLNVGGEAEAYLTFIVDEYHRLPEAVAFVHAHPSSWHQAGGVLSLLDGLGDLSKISYMNINKNKYNSFEIKQGEMPEQFARTFDVPHLSNMHIVESNIASLFSWYGGVHKEQLPPYYILKCCAQYVVSRRAILSRPLHHWRKILNTMYLLGDAEQPKAVAYNFEMMFFYLFTGLHDEYKYMQDKSYLVKA